MHMNKEEMCCIIIQIGNFSTKKKVFGNMNNCALHNQLALFFYFYLNMIHGTAVVFLIILSKNILCLRLFT